MSFLTSYTLFLPACPEVISIALGLQPNTTYRWEITTKFNKTYYGDSITDANGILAIPNASPMPAGLFTPYSGTFLLKVYTNNNEQKIPAKFTVQGRQYDVVELLFEDYETISNT